MSALEQYFAGTQGKVKASDATTGQTATNDWNVTEWEGTVTAKAAVTTTTKNYDATTKRTWTKRLPTTWELTGTFSFFYDNTNKPYAMIAPGRVVSVELDITDTDQITCLAYIDDVQHKSGGMDGVQMCTVKFTSQGTVTLPGDNTTNTL